MQTYMPTYLAFCGALIFTMCEHLFWSWSIHGVALKIFQGIVYMRLVGLCVGHPLVYTYSELKFSGEVTGLSTDIDSAGG